MGSKYFWKIPGGIQGQAGKPFAHQPGPTIQYPCMSQPVDNGCLCNYKAYKYWMYYEYLSPQLEPVSDAIVWDSSSKHWSTSSTMGYKWKPLGSQYLGCFQPGSYPFGLVKNSWTPVFWGDDYQQAVHMVPGWKGSASSKYTYNSTGNQILTVEAPKKDSKRTSGAYMDAALRYYVVNTYEPCGGAFYRGQVYDSAPQPPPVQPSSVRIYSTDKNLCVVNYKFDAKTFSFTVDKIYSNKHRVVLNYSNVLETPRSSAVYVQAYTQIPNGLSQSQVGSYCSRFASQKQAEMQSSAFNAYVSFAFKQISFMSMQWVTWPPISTYKMLAQGYQDQPVTWRLNGIGLFENLTSLQGKPLYAECDLAYSSYVYNKSVTSWSTLGLARPSAPYYVQEVDVVVPSASAVAEEDQLSFVQAVMQEDGQWLQNYLSEYAPDRSTLVELGWPHHFAVPYRGGKGGDLGPDSYHFDYQLLTQKSQGSAPCNTPNVQPYVMDSNYSFVKYDIWAIQGLEPVTIESSAFPIKGYGIFPASKRLQQKPQSVTITKFSSNMYQYQLYTQGWLLGDRFASCRPQYGATVFILQEQSWPAPELSSCLSSQRLSSYINGQWISQTVYVYTPKMQARGMRWNYLQWDNYSKYYRSVFDQDFDSIWSASLYFMPILSNAAFRLAADPYYVNINGSDNNTTVEYDISNLPVQERSCYLPAARGRNRQSSATAKQMVYDTWNTTVEGFISKRKDWEQGTLKECVLDWYFDYVHGWNGGSQLCSHISVTVPDRVFWYRANKYVPACKNSSLVLSPVPIGSSQYVHSYTYPAEYLNAIQCWRHRHDNFVFNSTKSWSFRKGTQISDSLFDLKSDPFSAFYVINSYRENMALISLSDPLFSNYLHNNTQAYQFTGATDQDYIIFGADRGFSSWVRGLPQSPELPAGQYYSQYLQNLTLSPGAFYGYDPFTSRYQDLVSAVSGTQCASCIHFSTIVFDQDAQLPPAQLGRTYVKFPDVVTQDTDYFSEVRDYWNAGDYSRVRISSSRQQSLVSTYQNEYGASAYYAGYVISVLNWYESLAGQQPSSKYSSESSNTSRVIAVLCSAYKTQDACNRTVRVWFNSGYNYWQTPYNSSQYVTTTSQFSISIPSCFSSNSYASGYYTATLIGPVTIIDKNA